MMDLTPKQKREQFNKLCETLKQLEKLYPKHYKIVDKCGGNPLAPIYREVNN